MPTFNHPSFAAVPVIGILRNFSPEEILFVADVFHAVGFTTLEVTLNSANALECIHLLSKQYPKLNIGAGTVCTVKDLEAARGAGATFIVSPIFDDKLTKSAAAQNLAVFPGALSPTEIFQAWQAGATAVKVFPASAFAPSYIKEILAPLPQISLLAVGGVGKNNIESYFKAGAIGVGMGSSLIDRNLIENRNREGLHSHFEELYNLVKESCIKHKSHLKK